VTSDSSITPYPVKYAPSTSCVDKLSKTKKQSFSRDHTPTSNYILDDMEISDEDSTLDSILRYRKEYHGTLFVWTWRKASRYPLQAPTEVLYCAKVSSFLTPHQHILGYLVPYTVLKRDLILRKVLLQSNLFKRKSTTGASKSFFVHVQNTFLNALKKLT